MFAKISFFNAAPKFLSTLLVKPSVKKHLEAIYNHPFNQELFKGTLLPETFSYYLRNDDYYLQQYAQILLKLGKKTKEFNPDLSEHLSYLANDILADETAMQRDYQKYYDLCPHVVPPGPAIKEYIGFLNQQKEEDLPVSLCSVLPCFWIYYQLGKNKLILINNPYNDWIQTYSSDVFSKATETLVEEINKIAATADLVLKTKMEAAFQEAIQHELNFFTESYTLSAHYYEQTIFITTMLHCK